MTIPESITTVIVDDELLARRRIRRLLKEQKIFTVVAECRHGEEAVGAIIKLRPDLVLLDIQMPKLNGFEVIQTVGAKNMPSVIFITAYDKYALRAFDINAVDYLLKPFDRKRFLLALQRGKRDVLLKHGLGTSRKVEKMLAMLRQEKRLKDRILLRSYGRINIIEINSIDWIRSAGNYVEIHHGDKRDLHRETMNNMEIRLQEHAFARCHRMVMVNLARVKSVEPQANGNARILLRDGRSLPLSRRYRRDFDHQLSMQM